MPCPMPAGPSATSIDDLALKRVHAEGFTPRDAGALARDLAGTLWGRGTGRPLDFDVSAVEKSILLVDLEDASLPHARYVVRARAIAGGTLSLVDVERYNLGPALRLDDVAAYGEDRVAPPEIFGVGPDVVWRFATRPQDGVPAHLVAAGRRETSPAIAAERRCPAGPCLSLDGLDTLGVWHPADLPIGGSDFTRPYEARPFSGKDSDRDREFAPAFHALRLGLAAGIVKDRGDDDVWSLPSVTNPDAPGGVTIVLDRNIGQDRMIDGAIGIAASAETTPTTWYRLTGAIVDEHDVVTGAVLDRTARSGDE